MHSTQLQDEYVCVCMWSCVSLTPLYSIYCVALFVLECFFFMMNEWHQQGLHFFFNVHCTLHHDNKDILIATHKESLGDTRTRVVWSFQSPIVKNDGVYKMAMVAVPCKSRSQRVWWGRETHRRSTVPPWGGGKLSKAVATSLVWSLIKYYNIVLPRIAVIEYV